MGGNFSVNDWVIMAIRRQGYKDEPVSLSTAALVHWFIVRESLSLSAVGFLTLVC